MIICPLRIVRLWQDAENRNLLASLLKKNAEQVCLFDYLLVWPEKMWDVFMSTGLLSLTELRNDLESWT